MHGIVEKAKLGLQLQYQKTEFFLVEKYSI
jgi:hypothetical protein